MSRYGGGGGGDRYGGGGGGDRYGGGGDRYGGGGGDRFGGSGGLGSGLRNIDWDLSKLPVFEKNFYIEHPAVSNRTESSAEEWRKAQGITVIGRGIPKPVYTFEEVNQFYYKVLAMFPNYYTCYCFM